MAIPQQPYSSDMRKLRPDDPGPVLGTLAEVPGVVSDAVGAYRDAEQGLARTINSGLPVPVLPVPPEGQGSFIPPSAPTAEEPPVAGPAAAAAAPALPEPAPALPAPNSVKSVTTDTRIVQSPAEKAAAAALAKANADAVKAQESLGKADAAAALASAQADQQQAAAAAEAERARAEQIQDAEAERAKQVKIAEDEVRAAEAKVRADTEAAGRTPFTGNLGASIFSALVTGASSLNAYDMGKDPSEMPAVKAIANYVEQDKANRLRQLAQSKEFLAERRKGPEAAQTAWANAVDRINIQAEQRLKTSLAQANALKANSKVDKGRFDAIANASLAKVQADAAESALKLAERTSVQRSTVTTRERGGAAAGGKYPIFSISGEQIGSTDQLTLANDVAAKRAGSLDAQRLGAELAAHVKEHGMTVLPGEAKATRESLTNDLISALVKARSGTAASDKERDVLTRVVIPGQLNQLFSSRKTTADQVQRFVTREVNRYNDAAASATTDPRIAAARARAGSPAPAPEGGGIADAGDAALQSALKAAIKAGDKTAQAQIAAELKARKK